MRLSKNWGIRFLRPRDMVSGKYFLLPHVDYRTYGKDYIWLCFLVWRIM